MPMPAVSFDIRGDVGLVLVDNPPVNAISHAVRQGIVEAFGKALAEDRVAAVVLACRGRTFMAGADIKEFGAPPKAPTLADAIAAIDGLDKPVLAAIHGTALGGGLELALACHYRAAVADARLGLPEVTLGLIPGGQGTQRLPRLVGVEAALEMIVGGKPVSATRALDIGLVDALIEGDPVEAAVDYARSLAESGAPLRRLSATEIDAAAVDGDPFDRFRCANAKRLRNLTAPERAIAAVRAAMTVAFEEGVARERALFVECLADPQSRALRHAFFAERRATQVPGLSKETPRRTIERVGIVGGGTMGRGIALACLGAGLAATVIEQDEEAAARARSGFADALDSAVVKGRLDESERSAQEERLAVETAIDALGEADLVIEAVFEDMAVKKEVFRRLDRLAKPGAILATNTSYLDVNAIAAETGRAEDVLGLHFFSPANIMKLLEIVRADKTSDDVLATALAFARTIGKTPVVAGVCRGFIGNRMLSGYVREAGRLILEGAAPDQVDRAIFAFGYPMGPFRMGDLAGLDVGYLARRDAPAGSVDETAFRVHDRLVEMDRKGQKTGAGFYDYSGDAPAVPAEVHALIEDEAKAAGIARRTVDDEEIVERCILPLVNEGARILEEGIALRASDIDVVYMLGYGFPRWRGGPMFWAEHEGLAHILDRIAHYRSLHGERWWTPADLLGRLVSEGRTFRDLDEG